MKKKYRIREEARKCYGNLLNYTKFNLISNHHDAEDIVSQTYIRFLIHMIKVGAIIKKVQIF